jgi:hypothetical protein
MKKIIFLTLSIFFLFPKFSYSYTIEECAVLSTKANIELVANLIRSTCTEKDNFFNINYDLKCSLKAKDAKDETTAIMIFSSCKNNQN